MFNSDKNEILHTEKQSIADFTTAPPAGDVPLSHNHVPVCKTSFLEY